MHLLITGASGKVGTALIKSLIANPGFDGAKIRALVFSRTLAVSDPRVEILSGSIADESFVNEAMSGITHVVHLATCKEQPSLMMDVTVKGMFWLLQAAKTNTIEKFILLGGDAAIGHYFYPAPAPLNEDTPFRATPGCYGLSKVLEEVMLNQFHIQYGLNTICLRSPWIMAEDDLKMALTFGDDVFGAPRWHEFVDTEEALRLERQNAIPLALDVKGIPLKRNCIAIEDVINALEIAIQTDIAGNETFQLAMDEPLDYGTLADYLNNQYGYPVIRVPTPYYSIRLDNKKARQQLGWRPQTDTFELADRAWSFQREGNPRKAIVYPG